ncbi:aminotransferase class III-fold pyridoxal phosphate-dependent enzyme [Clostridium algoriphilum]|uniref:aminotransferase class III-fold pyridoxal phosphate-dependent enzyme n=1 Tax=Clostridium algoriphilum TaxID=198347 RepID=UPI001CF5C5F5|nr:aminotransferase class III-fold pyridoxal phosphate-dependent enzyme [Clostridium algoriphilum]MCB2292250.1 aminotransferase class III-fold pyridoxal phosphate-dependent enzyme [Clostridium algoriphilum]
MGIKLKNDFLKLKGNYPIIYDVRGIGLMLGIELLKENGEPAWNEADFILEILKDEGILVGKNGLDRNVLAFQPPLIITDNDVDLVLDKFNLALSKLNRFCMK